jgi:hypothetical protein
MRISASLILTVLAAGSLRAAEDTGIEFFEKKVRPVLVTHCYGCHSSQAKKKQGGLLLDSRDGVRKGGDTGPVVTPGKPDDSLLLKAVRYTDDALKMPPKGKLPDAVIADLEAWVKMGAPDPRDAGATGKSARTWDEMLATRRQWWSLQPVRKPVVPETKTNWSNQPVDRFILAKLKEKGLAPADQADPRTIIRRLSLVLTGLPPTPEEIGEFEKSAIRNPQYAIEKLVDRLLASPHFGERWARHWMDVVHFSETHGNEWNYEVHHAWRYRDYLIRAFNEDLPYDQFVREHIAGDLLPQPRWNRKEHFNESVIGTAFYRFGEANHDDCISLPQIGYDLADAQIDTLSKAFQATTVACARCHDHKIDAVSMKDYYALLGTLRSARQVSHTIDAPEVNAGPIQQLRELKAKIRKELAATWQTEARDVGRYLLAAETRRASRSDAAELARGLDAKRLECWVEALRNQTPPTDDPLGPWRSVSGKTGDTSGLVETWKDLTGKHAQAERERAAGDKRFVLYADFRAGIPASWEIGGHGLRGGTSRSGDIVLASGGDAVVKAVLPAGCYSHGQSERLNGTLRSPQLPGGKLHISFQVLGRHGSAVRLVSNNCQLNYVNYRNLISDNLHWVTFTIPAECERVRVYAELMTMLDNPKFPDQLSGLGGDPTNYRVPWEQAVRDGRSYFGVTRVVLHDGTAPPKIEMTHLRPLFAGPEPRSLADLAGRYTTIIENAVQAWTADRATDDDVRWLDALVRAGLLGNTASQTPQLDTLVKQYRQTEAELVTPRVVPGVTDAGPGIMQPVLVRGDCTRPGETVPRRYLEVLAGTDNRFGPAGSGRRELAERIADPNNPLTARVMVNRVWHHLFGAGLVRTVDDFGRVGDLPSHPELLDYLAVRFVEDGWSMKRLIRTLVLTRTFQTANRPSPASQEADPQNRLLQHYPARRLEAEAIRDAILAASGRLDRTLYGMSVQPYRDKANADRRLFPGPLDGNGRRSIYIKNNLMEAPQFLGAFNFPGGKVTQGRRDVTNVPAQALALLNDPFVLQQADVWAGSLVGRRDDTVARRIDHMFHVALGRAPVKEERERFERAAVRLGDLHQVTPDGLLASRLVWKDLAHTMFNLKEFFYLP